MNKWISLPDLMQRWEPGPIENVFEAIRAGLPVFERKAPPNPSKPVWAGGGKESQVVQLITDEERQRPEKGQVYPHNVLFLVADVEAFELARRGAGQEVTVWDIRSQEDLAQMCGSTTRTIRNWIETGLPQDGTRKHFSRALTVKWLEKNGKHKQLESFNNSK